MSSNLYGNYNEPKQHHYVEINSSKNFEDLTNRIDNLCHCNSQQLIMNATSSIATVRYPISPTKSNMLNKWEMLGNRSSSQRFSSSSCINLECENSGVVGYENLNTSRLEARSPTRKRDKKYDKAIELDLIHNDEFNVYKSAKYEKEVARDAVITCLTGKISQHQSTMMSYQSNVKVDDTSKKSMSKRRNTISNIAFNKTTTSQSNHLVEQANTSMNEKKFQSHDEMNIFEIIEQENQLLLEKKLASDRECVNDLNELDFTPLDMSLMLNNSSLVRVLLQYDAVENPNFTDYEDRYDRVCLKLGRLDENLRSFLEKFDAATLSLAQITDYNLKLNEYDLKIKLYQKMKATYENARAPTHDLNVKLEVHNSTSLMVKFDQHNESHTNSNIIIKYLIEWSSSCSFEPLDGHHVLINDQTHHKKQYLIENLTTSKVYYVRVSCANIRGYGCHSYSCPPFAIPSYWRDGATVEHKRLKQLEKLINLENQISVSKSNYEFVNLNLLNNMQKFNSKTKKPSTLGLRKNLKTIFTLALASSNLASLASSNYSSTNIANCKFAKQIKKNTAYLISVVYENEKILTTHDDNLPMLEIEENYSSQNLNNDFHFLIKLSFNWNDIDSTKALIEQTINTSNLKFRYLILSVIKQMQNLLEITELGRVYYRYLKHNSTGSVFFVIVKNHKNLANTSIGQNLKVQDSDKLLYKAFNPKNSSTSLNKDPNDEFYFLIKNVKNFIEFDVNSENKLTKGLYVGFLKLQSNIEMVKVIVPTRLPNCLPCQKVRDNPNVSKEEWNLLKSVKFNLNKLSINELNSIQFLRILSDSILSLSKQLDYDESEVDSLRLILKELIEINEDLTIILLCPPIEQTCQMQLTDDSLASTSSASNEIVPSLDYIYLPVQLFEAINFYTYDKEFISSYSKISIKLDIESVAANQFNREAFSNDEINKSKHILSLVANYLKSLEDIWKDSRWILESINYARDKQLLQPQQHQHSNMATFGDLKSFISLFDSSAKNSICPCYQAHVDTNNNTEYTRNRKNIYNQITKLPPYLDSHYHCNCESPQRNYNYLTTRVNLSCHHIDSILIEDEDLPDTDTKLTRPEKKQLQKQPNLDQSIEDLRVLNLNLNLEHSSNESNNSNCELCMDCQKNCRNCRRTKHLTGSKRTYSNSRQFSSATSQSSDNFHLDGEFNAKKKENIHKLVSKLYISAPCTPTMSTEQTPKFAHDSPTVKPAYQKSKSNEHRDHNTSLSLSIIDDFHAKLSSLFSRNISVFVDFQTGLKIDISFECTINNRTYARELVGNIVKRLNSFIYCFNLLNKTNNTYDLTNMSNLNCDDYLMNIDFNTSRDSSSLTTGSSTSSTSILNFDWKNSSHTCLENNRSENASLHDSKPTTSSKHVIHKNNANTPVNLLDENTDLYYLIIILNDDREKKKTPKLREKIVTDDCLLSNLKQPWISGNFYLRKNK